MRILAINVGSSSVKAGLVEEPAGAERLHLQLPLAGQPIEDVVASLSSRLREHDEPSVDAVGHRVVHGGDRFEPLPITAGTLAELDALSHLAPLHNPPALRGVRAALAHWPAVPHFAVFDTAFHRRMPAIASTYAVPQSWRSSGVRRFGFHGLSHGAVAAVVARELGRASDSLRIVSCHLGNGASACAINRGVSCDTSMGMTPVEGLVMGTRPGDLDAGAAAHVLRATGMTPEAFEHALQHDCGLAALAGHGGDFRRIEAAASSGDERSIFALDLFAYRVRKYIGAYAAAMEGLDAIAFTGGIGEHSSSMRARICSSLGFLGVRVDEALNAATDLSGVDAVPIHGEGTAVGVLVVKAREERAIARHVFTCLG